MVQAMGPRSQPSWPSPWQPAPKVSTSLCTEEGEGGRKEVEGEINDSNTHTCYIVNTCGFKHVPTHTCTHTHTRTHPCTHTHAHAHTHTQNCLLKGGNLEGGRGWKEGREGGERRRGGKEGGEKCMHLI